MKWYVLFVESGKEEKVQKWLNFHFDKLTLYSIIPLRRLKEKRRGNITIVHRSLFPGYVFIKTKMDIHKYYILKSIPGLIRMLGDNGYYSEISDKEIAIILKLIGKTNVINCSKVCVENSKMFIKSGPLRGLEGIIKKVDKHKNRAKIVLTLMGEARMIDVEIEWA